MALISLAEYAAMHSRAPVSVQQKARRGGFRTAQKIGHNWVIDSDEPYEDNRYGPETSLGLRTCRQCGKSFRGGPRAWYCPECRAERKMERDRIRQRNLRSGIGPDRSLGSIDHCERCGKEYVVKGGRQRYCPECAPLAAKEVDRSQALKHYADVKDIVNPRRNEKRRIKIKICAICGKEFPADGTARNTCSKACRKEQRRRYQAEADKKRGQKNKAHPR